MARLLVTGSAGLVGRALGRALRAAGHQVVEFDLVDGADVRDAAAVAAACAGCDGVVHLAAVSRVVWAQQDPEGCVETNVGGTRNVLAARPPVVLFASSREVYGECGPAPVDEDAPLTPLNVYGRAKVTGEALVLGARAEGATTGVVRLSNVYGCPEDHADRVVPAFLHAALRGGRLRVEGADRFFDFTWLDDVVAGLVALVHRLLDGEQPPVLHLVSGRSTTLGALADLAIATAGAGRVVAGEERDYDVRGFRGDPSRAAEVLGWRSRVSVEEGLERLAAALR
jgi:nucleoside-diphosphate-sugar epimerase